MTRKKDEEKLDLWKERKEKEEKKKDEEERELTKSPDIAAEQGGI